MIDVVKIVQSVTIVVVTQKMKIKSVKLEGTRQNKILSVSLRELEGKEELAMNIENEMKDSQKRHSIIEGYRKYILIEDVQQSLIKTLEEVFEDIDKKIKYYRRSHKKKECQEEDRICYRSGLIKELMDFKDDLKKRFKVEEK